MLSLPKFTRSDILMITFLSVVVLLLLGIYHDTVIKLVNTLAGSETYSHGFLVPFAAVALAWAARSQPDQRSNPGAGVVTWPGYLGIVAWGAFWFLSELAGVNLGNQLALIGIFVAILVAVFGWASVRRYWFALAFLLFMIPFGDFLEYTLMVWTADATVWLLRVSGFAVYRDGLHFQLPSGRWSVVEACSGMRYLLAALPLGAVFAYFSYQSLRRRVLFMLACVAVPIVANWLRAYMIVLIGHYSGMTLAVGVDHLVYGWVFFGLVVFLLFWLGGKWAEPAPEKGPAPATAASVSAGPLYRRAAVALVLALAWPLLASQFMNATPEVSNRADFSRLLNPERQAPRLPFKPEYTGYQVAEHGRLGDAGADFFVAMYSKQHKNGELVAWSNKLVPFEGSRWYEASRSAIKVESKDGPVAIVESELRSVSGENLLVWSTYVVGKKPFADEKRVKLYSAWRHMFEFRDDAYFLSVQVPVGQKGLPEARAQVKTAFDLMLTRLTAFTPQYSRP